MLMPKKVKYRKQMRGRRNGKAWRGGDLALRRVRIESHGMRVDHRPADRSVARGDYAVHQARRKIVDPDFPDKPFTKKPAETRMGKGKGAPEKWVAVVKPGTHHVRDGGEWTKRRPRKPWGWRRTSCRFPRSSFPAREGFNDAAAN